MITILIADDHNVVVEGIDSLLTGLSDIEVVGHCATVQDVKEKIEKLSVDVILLDISFPKTDDGINLCEFIAQQFSRIKIIALTMHDDSSIIKRVFKKGGHGYLLKNTSKAELIEAIKTVYEGKQYTNNFIQALMEASHSRNRKNTAATSEGFSLTPREKEILFLISEGYTTQQIATKLFVTQKAVEFHRSGLLVKFDVPNTAQLIKLALQKNYL